MMAALAVVLALALDLAVGEPPRRYHPVAWFGGLVAPVDRPWARPRLVGAVVALGVPMFAALTVGALVGVAAHVWLPLGVTLAGLALFVTTSLRRLRARARNVIETSGRDLAAARRELRALAGRDAANLSPGAVRSAAVESAAENLADGLVAPLGAFVVGALVGAAFGPTWALAFAATGATWVKAVNTLDSMFGYASKPVGWAPAHLDDLVMWLPARASALLLAIVARRPRALGASRRWLAAVPSPNSGWPMGTLAAARDVRLAKPGVYVLNPDAEFPSVEEGRRAVRIVTVAGLVAYALATVGLAAVAIATGTLGVTT